MTQEINEKLKATLAKLHREDPDRGIDLNTDRLVNDFAQRKNLQLRNGVVTDGNGKRIDLENDLSVIVDSSSYIHASKTRKGQYVSPWPIPSKQQRDQIASDVLTNAKKLTDLHGIVFVDQAAQDRALKTISENFIFESENGEVSFAKLNEGGIPGFQRYPFDQLIPAHLIDHEQTSLAKELRFGSYRELARKILPIDAKEPAIVAKANQLRKQQFIKDLPARRLPNIPQGEFEREVKRKESIIRGIDVNAGGNDANILRLAASRAVEALDDLTPVMNALNQIQPQPIQGYEGLHTN